MPNITYYAEFREVKEGYTGKVAGLDITSSGETFGNCRERLDTALKMYIDLLREEGKPIPEPVHTEGALPLEIKIMKSALVVQRHDSSLKVLQELLTEMDYESTPTDDLEDAVRYLGQRRFDAVVTGSMYKTAPGEEVDDTAWEKLHKEVQRKQPKITFILYSAIWDLDPSSYKNPTVHHISKITALDELKESFRQLLE